MSYEGPGIYRHYKGGYYRVVGTAKHESDGTYLVIYHSYSVDHDLSRWMDGVDWVARPLNPTDGADCFNDMLTELPDLPPDDPAWYPRFKKVTEL
jgi:Protein of unknown function (DUF1653)